MIGLGYFWTELRKRIEREEKEQQSYLLTGVAADWTTYQKQVAYLKALNFVKDQAAEILGEKETQRQPTQTDEED